MEKEYMTVTEAAALLGVNRRTIWRMISLGRLDAVQNPMDHRVKLVRRADIERLAAYTTKPAP